MRRRQRMGALGTRLGIGLGTVLVTVLALGGCAATQPPAGTAPPASIELPATPVGAAMAWVVDELNAEGDTTAERWTRRLDEATASAAGTTTAASAAQIVQVVNQSIRPARPVTVTAYTGEELEAVATLQGAVGDPFQLTLAVTDAELITGIFFAPVAAERDPAESLDEVAERLAALPGTTRTFVTLDAETLLAADAERAAPLGSIFKLFVLLALADAVAAGEIAWDDTLVLTDEVRSLPSGTLQNEPTGTELSVADAATRMIAASDNTATDLVMAALGAERIEAAVAASGHHDPALLRPFPTTREMFALSWGGHSDLTARWTTAWADGDGDARRAVLAELDARAFEVTVADVDLKPRFEDGLEWFASATDVAAVHDALASRAAVDPRIDEILTANPGIGVDAADWPRVAFKGGSSAGVLTGSWRAVAADGAVLRLVVLSANPDGPLDAAAQQELFGLAEDVFRIVAAGR